MSRIYIGVDLGKKGGLVATLDGKIIAKAVMPLVADTDVDVFQVRQFIDSVMEEYPNISVHIILEKFAGFFGYMKSAAVSLARQGGMVEAMLVLSDFPHTKVMPQVWQKVVWADSKVLKKKDGKKDTKKISLLTAKRLFPSESFLATSRSEVPHDGMVDAALLSIYGFRKGL